MMVHCKVTVSSYDGHPAGKMDFTSPAGYSSKHAPLHNVYRQGHR